MGKPLFLYRTYLPTADVTATDSYAGTDPNNVLGSTEDVFWRPADTSGEKILTFDFKEVINANAIGIIGSGLDGALVTFEASTDLAFTAPVITFVDEILSAPVNVGYFYFPDAVQQVAQYMRLKFSGFGSEFRISHVIFAQPSPAPFLEEDWTPDRIDETGTVLESAGGLFLGAQQFKTMRIMPLEFGQVDSVEYAILQDWAKNCIETLRPFVFVPDIDDDACFFGWVDKPTFSAPYRDGYRTMESLKMRTRAK